jgi:hypothetical protein
VSDLLEKAVRSESPEHARHLTAVEFRQMATERVVLQPGGVELAANGGAKQIFIIRVEPVEHGVAAALQFHGL